MGVAGFLEEVVFAGRVVGGAKEVVFEALVLTGNVVVGGVVVAT